ncbi:preprotein translocase subunit YajC [Macrococcus lamae]|uniref:Preprotein translocase subunit YajC n=1 Tax=Macrococcus lamae TaxID=198484 RepID=A0A4V3BF87_9STAP|nr:preprotein translocase subunit YajC [Macrococcus lamae]TDM13046.1 preprotein translocase subunit YajC [Macrococcus lamae]
MNEQFQLILLNVLPLLVLLLVAYFAIIRPGQKRAKAQQQLMNNLKRGDKIVTIGGIHGTVRAVDIKTLTIAVNSKGQELIIDKEAVKSIRLS